MIASDDRPIHSRDDLLEPFRDACKPRSRFRVGTEAEKFGVLVDSGKPLPYSGTRGVRTVLERLCANHGWVSEPEVPGGPVIALRRGEASITLEPGGQLELSGAPLETIHQTRTEFDGHLAELRAPSEELGIAWLALGFHPLARREDIEWVPKLRYGVMREYLPTRGRLALDMMLRTCTVQANFDYADEADAVTKMRVASAASPFVTAMFANSPLTEGRPAGDMSYRARVWLEVDPDRTGIPEMVFEEGFGFERWAAWALDVPMFLFKRDGKVVGNTGQTFRSFLADGFEGHRPTLGDWEMHINTLFPEVRLKRTIELRGADNVPASLLCALPALWKGLLYDPQSLAEAWELLRTITAEERRTLRAQLPRDALGTTFRGAPIRGIAESLVDLAARGLARIGHLSESGQDESIHLAPLRQMVHDGRCPADGVLARWQSRAPGDPGAIADLIASCRY